MSGLTKRVTHPFIIAMLILAAQSSASTISPGDIVVVRGKIQGCGDRLRVLDFKSVEADGWVTLFGEPLAHGELRFYVREKSEGDVAEDIARRIEEAEGYRPMSLVVERVTGGELIQRKQKGEMLQRQIKCLPHLFAPDEGPKQRENEGPEVVSGMRVVELRTKHAHGLTAGSGGRATCKSLGYRAGRHMASDAAPRC